MAISDLLPLNTIIEVVRIKGEEVVVKEMSVDQWQNLVKQKGYNYKAFQKGFSQYKRINHD